LITSELWRFASAVVMHIQPVEMEAEFRATSFPAFHKEAVG
jgi:hypothetical protein